jgi:hypothetical protein
MRDYFFHTWTELIGRWGGPMAFRLILQPIAASIIAMRSGLKDARQGRPLYFWSIFSDPVHRRELIREGWKDIVKVFIAAVVIDLIYQFIVFRWFYPVQALILAVILAIVPYLLIRGVANRIARRRLRSIVPDAGNA